MVGAEVFEVDQELVQFDGPHRQVGVVDGVGLVAKNLLGGPCGRPCGGVGDVGGVGVVSLVVVSCPS